MESHGIQTKISCGPVDGTSWKQVTSIPQSHNQKYNTTLAFLYAAVLGLSWVHDAKVKSAPLCHLPGKDIQILAANGMNPLRGYFLCTWWLDHLWPLKLAASPLANTLETELPKSSPRRPNPPATYEDFLNLAATKSTCVAWFYCKVYKPPVFKHTYIYIYIYDTVIHLFIAVLKWYL